MTPDVYAPLARIAAASCLPLAALVWHVQVRFDPFRPAPYFDTPPQWERIVLRLAIAWMVGIALVAQPGSTNLFVAERGGIGCAAGLDGHGRDRGTAPVAKPAGGRADAAGAAAAGVVVAAGAPARRGGA